jgi:SAM-dependent methyltransferase
MEESRDQGRHWGRHARRYDDLFLDPFREGVENPVLATLLAVPEPGSKTVADLGCGTGPLLPLLAGRFRHVFALDFAPGMLERARARLGSETANVTFLARPMHALDDFEGRLDVALAINSLVMPDVRVIDQTLRAIRNALTAEGRLLGVVPAIDAIQYHTMLLMDRALERGYLPEEAERYAAYHAEHKYYNFAFGRFRFRGLHQKFWTRDELEYRLSKADFSAVELGRVLYPWDDDQPGGTDFADHPRSWDWSFVACP